LKRVEVFVGEKNVASVPGEPVNEQKDFYAAKPCGSELAREEGIPVNIDVD
jgi:hypothetical protein